MRRVLWLVLVGAVCLGCARKEPPEVPNVALAEERGPGGTVPVGGAALPQAKTFGTFGLPFSKLWDPKTAEKFDAEAAMKQIVAERHFAAHQTEYLAPTTVGTAVSLVQGGWHGAVGPVCLAAVYPDVGKKMESEWADRLTAPLVSTAPMLDYSTHATGAPSTRTMVFRVKGGDDGALSTRFDQYATRVEEAVKAALDGSKPTALGHERGEPRPTGAMLEIVYQTETHTGYVRSALVRGFDENDTEFVTKMFDNAKGRNAALFKSVMNAEKGPFLVVALEERPR